MGSLDSGQAQAAWTYEESLAWLYARQSLGIKLGLGKVERLLHALGDPQGSFRSVHVAGTNGKGSVTRMLALALQRAGLRTGCTTSPHLVRFTERIEVDGVPIARPEVARGLALIRDAVRALDTAGDPPTFFECVTGLAFWHFREAGAQWAVVETGMGGRLDATNVLRPDLAIITNVDLDHMAHLGPTILDIAWEKAGIMKPKTPLVTAATGQALEVLKARSHDLRVPMSVVGEDYQVVRDVPGAAGDDLVLLRPTGESRYRVGLAGAHQRINAAMVVAAAEALRRKGVALPETALRDALARASNPGRLETFATPGPAGRRVEVLVDGAHNPAAAHALRHHLGRTGWSGFHLVAGFCADKQWRESLDAWLPLAAQVWAVPVRNPRTLDASRVRDHALAAGFPARAEPDARAAIAAAVAAGAERILVAGSLFLAGEARAVLTGDTLEEIHGSQ